MYTVHVTITVFTQCPDSGVEPGRWVRSILHDFIDLRLHSDPAQGADPTRGAEWMSSSMKFCVLHVEKFHTLRGQTWLSVYKKKMRGRTLQIWRSTKGGSDPAIGAGDCIYTKGQKAGLTPQSEHCVNAVIYVHTNCVQSLHDSPVHIITLYMSTG